MLFSIIIPTYNNLAELKACLDSIERLNQRSFEVFVCIDGSNDGTDEFLKNGSFSFPVKVLNHPENENRGRSATRNLALPHLSGKFVLLLDSDMRATPDLLDKHLEVVGKGDQVSIGSIKYLNADENLWARYISTRGAAKFSDGEKVPHHYFITPNTALPTPWIKELEGFDKQIDRYGGEDMEFGYRLFLKYKPAFVFKARAMATTIQDKKLDAGLAQLREYGRTGLKYIIQKHPEMKSVYWIDRVESGNSFWEFIRHPIFQKIARFLLRVSPFFAQRFLINYLVICAVHEGYKMEGE